MRPVGNNQHFYNPNNYKNTVPGQPAIQESDREDFEALDLDHQEYIELMKENLLLKQEI